MQTHSSPEEALFALIHRLNIQTQHFEHQAVFTVGESEGIHRALPGFHKKNLFLKDERGAFWLVTASIDTQIDLKALRTKIGSKRLSFGKPEALVEVLGVEQGAVTPLAVINDPAQRVTLVLDAKLQSDQAVNIHPLRNTATIGLSGLDLIRVLKELILSASFSSSQHA